MKLNNRIKFVQEYIISTRCDDSKQNLIYLDWNESRSQIHPQVLSDVMASINSNLLAKYPDTECAELRKSISEYNHNISEKHILVYNGSDDALNNIFEVLVDENTRVLIYSPSYQQVQVFITAKTKNITVSHIIEPLEKHEYDWAPVKHSDVIYLVNPNNPTGYFIETEVIEQLIKAYPEKMFVIDEAYYEFVKKSSISLIKQYNNIIITRTFSKAWGLTGLRVGYVLANIDIINELMKIRNGKSVNSIAQIATISSLRNPDLVEEYIHQVTQVKNMLQDFTSKHIKVFVREGNFFLIKTKEDIKDLIAYLRDRGIVIRDRSLFKNLENCARITITDMGTIKLVISLLHLYTKN